MHDSEASKFCFISILIDLFDCTQAPNFVPREHLKSWQERHYNWLELSDVSKDVTHQVRVTVIPFYMYGRGYSYHLLFDLFVFSFFH